MFTFARGLRECKKYVDLALSLNHENVTAKNTKKIIESRLRPTEVQVSEFIKTITYIIQTIKSMRFLILIVCQMRILLMH